jgi:hypothetical protein
MQLLLVINLMIQKQLINLLLLNWNYYIPLIIKKAN